MAFLDQSGLGTFLSNIKDKFVLQTKYKSDQSTIVGNIQALNNLFDNDGNAKKAIEANSALGAEVALCSVADNLNNTISSTYITDLNFVENSGVTLKLGNESTKDLTNYIAKYNRFGFVKPPYASTNAATLTTAAASNTNTPTIAKRTTTTGRYYGIEADKNGYLFVNVPWTTKIYAGNSQTVANNTTTSNPYIKIADGSTYSSQIQLKGSGGTTVSSDSNGVITISSTGTDTSLGDLMGATAIGKNSLPIYWNGNSFSTISSYEGNSASATEINYSSVSLINNDTTLDSFLGNELLKVSKWNLGNSSSIGWQDGIILSASFNQLYGIQIALDDDNTYNIALRQKYGGTWNSWKKIPMADGTNATGTWGIDISGKAGAVEWSKITNKPTTFTPNSHTQDISSINNLQTALDGKADSSHTHSYAGSSSAGGAATSANKVNSSLKIKLKSGKTENTNLFTFDGSTAKTIDITASSLGITSGTSLPSTGSPGDIFFLYNA